MLALCECVALCSRHHKSQKPTIFYLSATTNVIPFIIRENRFIYYQ